ncbi:4'-phosphopantetheinyl transferase superfamily protein [uncultured Vibrio sp.]|uniref:4'-phosphopantetheinyl transferase family protein n=1 Tax=uncultured Vibrio sp. TaxID=114054 RepID=UPI0025EF6B11|nr:4'-phosphopantetheinyl transferase superfamily protein [uncultured Vibrio sp.]
MLKSHLDVDLWLCPLAELNASPKHIASLKKSLTDNEVTKVDRYRQPKAQLKALYTRYYLRSVLSRYSENNPDYWRFDYGKKGKPSLCSAQFDQTGIVFNISHSQDHLVIAVCRSFDSDVLLGVDIEHSRENTDIHAITKHYFTHEEIAVLETLNDAAQRERFFDLWALKESYIKATGQGLATSLKSFSFDFKNQELHFYNVTNETPASVYPSQVCIFKGISVHSIKSTRALNVAQQANPSDWQCLLGRLNETFRFAVTVGGTDKEIDLRIKAIDSCSLG